MGAGILIWHSGKTQRRKFMKRIGVLLLVLGFFFSCKDFKEVQVTGVKGFRITKAGINGIEATITLGIKNPNDKGFSIYPSEFDVVYSGINLGKARLSKRVHIDSNCEKPYDFILKSDF